MLKEWFGLDKIMKLLIISDMTGGPGGVYTHIQQIESLLPSIEVHILFDMTTQEYVKKSYRFGNITFCPLSHKFHDEQSIKDSLDGALKSFRPDIIHVMNGSIRSNLLIREYLISKKIPFLVTEHYVDRSLVLNDSLLRAIKKINSHTPCTVFVSNESRDVAICHFGLLSKRNAVIHNGMVPVVRVKSEYRTKPRKIYTVARCVPQKGIDTVIRALAEINEYKLEFCVFGDGENRQEYEDLARELLKNNHEFKVLGWKDDMDHAKISGDYDLFVLASRQEGLSYSLIEAVAIGMPVICSRATGNSELLNACGCGHLFQVNDYHDLATEIKKFIADPDELVESARKGVEAAKRLFNARIQMKLLEKLYSEILS